MSDLVVEGALQVRSGQIRSQQATGWLAAKTIIQGGLRQLFRPRSASLQRRQEPEATSTSSQTVSVPYSYSTGVRCRVRGRPKMRPARPTLSDAARWCHHLLHFHQSKETTLGHHITERGLFQFTVGMTSCVSPFRPLSFFLRIVFPWAPRSSRLRDGLVPGLLVRGIPRNLHDDLVLTGSILRALRYVLKLYTCSI